MGAAGQGNAQCARRVGGYGLQPGGRRARPTPHIFVVIGESQPKLRAGPGLQHHLPCRQQRVGEESVSALQMGRDCAPGRVEQFGARIAVQCAAARRNVAQSERRLQMTGCTLCASVGKLQLRAGARRARERRGLGRLVSLRPARCGRGPGENGGRAGPHGTARCEGDRAERRHRCGARPLPAGPRRPATYTPNCAPGAAMAAIRCGCSWDQQGRRIVNGVRSIPGDGGERARTRPSPTARARVRAAAIGRSRSDPPAAGPHSGP